MSYLQDIASNVNKVREHNSFLPDVVIDSDLQNSVRYGKAIFNDCSNASLDPQNRSLQSSQNTLSQPMSLGSSPHSDQLMKTYNSSRITAGKESTNILGARPRPTPGRPPQFNGEIGELRSVYEIPQQYRHIFSAYPAFNVIQSRILDTILYSDRPIVISAPTGSGKTVIFELAIVRLLMKMNDVKYTGNFKIVYMAPVKALCAERYQDWQEKFSCLGLNCQEITGDSTDADLEQLSNYNLVLTTPEKWDSLTRRWKQNKKLVQVVKLFLIDEVHLVSDEKRGPTLEAVVSRMKTVQDTLEYSKNNHNSDEFPFNIRFLAVSATIPNIEDVAAWLGDSTNPAVHMKFGEEYRPVKLQQVVLGYEHIPGKTAYVFEMHLTYKLRDILFKYAENKPTLIFCSTRKSVLQTVEMLSKQITFSFNAEQNEKISLASSNLVDNKLRGFLMAGVGAHHAGMDVTDRRIMEELFRQAILPVLVTTSTLAMGVNLPAHLVIIKSTQQYNSGIYQDYSDSQLLQMIGRAGRPQFDSSATAVIMTKSQDRARYLRLVGGSDVLESNLHRHLGEHLNSEIVLETITDKFIAMKWIRSTFLYVRAIKNPKYYGISGQLTTTAIENNLQDLVMRELNILASIKLINMEDIMDLRPTEAGKLMATFYTSVKTMKAFNTITGNETLQDMVSVIATCHEFADIQLRRAEKRILNVLNQSKECETIRFPFKGVVRDNPMKVNVLLQAVFGCLTIPEHSLHQDSVKITRMGERISKCLARFLFRDEHYKSLLNGTILAKCFYSKLWENSIYVTRQLKKIGPVYSAQLASAGKTTFQSIIEANPRDLERILHKPPPLGNELKESASHLPNYGLEIHLTDSQSKATIILTLVNLHTISEFNTAGPHHWLTFLIGDSNNKVLVKERFKDEFLIQLGGSHTWYIDIDPLVEEVHAHLISDHWVGIDVETNVIITNAKERQTKANMKQALEQYALKRDLANTKTPSASKKMMQVTKPKKLTIIEQIKNMAKQLPEMNVKRLQCDTPHKLTQTNLDQFLYTPVKNKKLLPWKEFVESYPTTSAVYQTSMLTKSPIGETLNAVRSDNEEPLERNESDIEWVEDTPPSILPNLNRSSRTYLNCTHNASVLPKYPGSDTNRKEYIPMLSCMTNTSYKSVCPEDSQSSTHFSKHEIEANSPSSAHSRKHFKVSETEVTRQRNVDEIYKICKPITEPRKTKFSEFQQQYNQAKEEMLFPWNTEMRELKYRQKMCIGTEVRVSQQLLEKEAGPSRERAKDDARTTTRQLTEAEIRAKRQVPEAEARTTRQLPEAEAETIRQLPEAEAETIRQLPEAEAATIRQLPEAEAGTIRQLPEAEAGTIRQLPEAEASTTRQLPEVEARTIRQLPEAVVRNIRRLPEAEASTIRQLPKAVGSNIRQLPEVEARTIRQLPEAVGRNIRQLPEAEAGTIRQLPEAEGSTIRQLPKAEARNIRQLPEAEVRQLLDIEARTIIQLPEAEARNVEAEVKPTDLPKRVDIFEVKHKDRIVLPYSHKSNKGVKEQMGNGLPKHYYPIFIKSLEDSMSFRDASHNEANFSEDNLSVFNIEENTHKDIQLGIEKGRISDMAFGKETFLMEDDKNGSYPVSKDNVQFQIPKLDFDLGLDALLEFHIHESPENNTLIGCTGNPLISNQELPKPTYLDIAKYTRKYKTHMPKWDPNDPAPMTLFNGSPTTSFGLNKVEKEIKETVQHEDEASIFNSKVQHIHQQLCSFEDRTLSSLQLLNENPSTAASPSATELQLQTLILQQSSQTEHSSPASENNEEFACVTKLLQARPLTKQSPYHSHQSSKSNDQQTTMTSTQESTESPCNSSSPASADEHNESDFKWRCSQETFTQRSTIGNLSQSEDSDSDCKEILSPLSVTGPCNANLQAICTQQTKQHDYLLRRDLCELYPKDKPDIERKYEIHPDVSPVMSPAPVNGTIIPMQDFSQRYSVNSCQTRNVIEKLYPMPAEYFHSSTVKCTEHSSTPNLKTKHNCLGAKQEMCTQNLVQQYGGPLRNSQHHYTWSSPNPKHINTNYHPYEPELHYEKHGSIQPSSHHCTQGAGEPLSHYSPLQHNMYQEGEKKTWQIHRSTQQTNKILHLSQQKSIDEEMGDDPNLITPVEYIHNRLLQTNQGYSPQNANDNSFPKQLVNNAKYYMESSPSQMRCYPMLENPNFEQPALPIHHSVHKKQIFQRSPNTIKVKHDTSNSYLQRLHHSSRHEKHMEERPPSENTSQLIPDKRYSVKMPTYIQSNSEYPESIEDELRNHKIRKRQRETTNLPFESHKSLYYIEATAKKAKLNQEIKSADQSQHAQPARTVSDYFQQFYPVQGSMEIQPKINTAEPINTTSLDQGKLFSYCQKITPSLKQVCSSKSRKKPQFL